MKNMGISIDKTLAAGQFKKEKEYWLKQLSGKPEKSIFPYDHLKREKETPAAPGEIKITFPGELSSKLIRLGAGKEHRIHIVLLAVLMALLEKYTGKSDIIVGVPIYKQEKEGRFINTALALRQQLPQPGDMTFKQLLMQVRQTLAEAVDHQNYPLDTLVYLLDMPVYENEFPLFDIILLLENIHDKKYIRHLPCNMVFSFSRTGDTIDGKVEYNSLRYETGSIECIVQHFTNLLASALAGIELPLSSLEILPPAEKHRVLYEFNNTAVDYPGDRTLSMLFADLVKINPDRIALIEVGSRHQVRETGVVTILTGQPGNETRHLSFGELHRNAQQLAHQLREKGVKSDSIVALLTERSLEMIIGIVAALTAGGAYMPIDPRYPWERIHYMLTDSSADVLITTEIRAKEVKMNLEIILIDSFECSGVSSSYFLDISNSHPGNLAYVLYTSGSTGGPKGVMVEHKNVVRLVKNANYVELSGATRILQTGSPVFDATTFEIWGALLNGGQLVLASKELVLDTYQLGNILKKHHINTIWLTSSLFNQLVHQDSVMFSVLEWLLVGGDVLSPRHINQVRRTNKRLKVVNGYGPTENTTFSTAYLIKSDFETSIPIGGPINNSTVYILDRNYQLKPIGVVGEMWVGGDGVARGYLNNPDLTSERFINKKLLQGVQGDSFLEKSPPGRRRQNIYKTGDLGKWLSHGIIEFIGREDFQVKIRGHRIELGEIESRLLKHNSIKEVVVVTGHEREPFLCAYFVSDKKLTAPELRGYLKETLPGYMVPEYFIRLEKFPYTFTGKIDRSALPHPKAVVEEHEAHQPPTNEIEAAILETWSEVLEIDPGKIGIEDDFFDLGGNSINILKVHGLLRQQFYKELPLGNLFQWPTIRDLAANIMNDSLEKKVEKQESIVKLNNGKNKKNIFIFHPMHGMVYPYKELAKLLENRFNVYGIQSKGLTAVAPLPQTYEEMLKDYLAAIKTVQVKGPYILAGYCIGSILAYEAARELEDRGEQVEKLILLDIGTFMPENPGLFHMMRISLEGIFFYFHLLFRKSGPTQAALKADREEQQLRQLVETNNKLIFTGYNYKRIIRSPLIHIRAQKNLSLQLFQKSWKELSQSSVNLFKSPGHHHNIFESPNVEQLAELIKANID